MKLWKRKVGRECIFILLMSNYCPFHNRRDSWIDIRVGWSIRKEGKNGVRWSRKFKWSRAMQSLIGILRIFNLDLWSKRNSPKCFKQGSDMNIVLMFLKAHSGNRTRRDVKPGKFQKQEDVWQWLEWQYWKRRWRTDCKMGHMCRKS